jgi:hypothetical protein
MQKVSTNTIFALPHVRCHSLVRVVHCLLQNIQPQYKNQKIFLELWNFFYPFLTILINRCVGTSVADPVLFNPWIQDPDPGWKTNPESGSRMNITDLIFKNVVLVFRVKNLEILRFLDADSDSGSCQPQIRDGSNRILEPGYKHPGSAKLVGTDHPFLGYT